MVGKFQSAIRDSRIGPFAAFRSLNRSPPGKESVNPPHLLTRDSESLRRVTIGGRSGHRTVSIGVLNRNCELREVHRWLRQDQFTKAFRLARRESFAQAISLTQRYTPLAINTLAK